VPGYEDDREPDACRRERTLKIETTLTWQSHIEDETRGAVVRLGLEIVGDGCKQLGAQAYRPQEAAERCTEFQIIVDHHDAGV
jgi:hypothetical protein